MNIGVCKLNKCDDVMEREECKSWKEISKFKSYAKLEILSRKHVKIDNLLIN